MAQHRVTLFFRKPRGTGSFSIETSFRQMISSYPADSQFALNTFTSSHYSNGILPRILGILEARRHLGEINHVTGDVHYLVLCMPGKRTVLTVHDCGLMNHPNRLARRILKLFWLDLPVRHCRYITAVSEATRQDIIRHTGCDPNKVVVVPTVISESFSRIDKTFNRDCPRILHIGLAPNKNLSRHAEALADLDCHLHIIGKLGPQHIKQLEHHNISYTSEYNINQEEIQRAYAECDMLLFASTLEGFGMPIVEAQTVGRPVITSNISSMPEVAGDAALLVDPYSVRSIRKGIEDLINDPELRSSLVTKGYRNAARFSAAAVARQYEELYGRMLPA